VPLPLAEVQRVVRETKAARNASARRRRLSRKEAERWCQVMKATTSRWPHFGEVRYTVLVAGFHPVTALTLEQCVDRLDRTIAAWCEGPASKGPTGASLARYRALRASPQREGG
jgi:hypothetical protein